MRTDTLIKNEGMMALRNNLGMVEMEHFILLIQRDTFDYTKWQDNLLEDLSIEEISERAAQYRMVNDIK